MASYPVYLVVSTPTQPGGGLYFDSIRKVYATVIDERGQFPSDVAMELSAMYNAGGSPIRTAVYVREPDNPFRAFVEGAHNAKP